MASVKGATRVATGALNLYFIYKFLRILTTPWTETEAFQLKIIDDKGNILKKKRTLKSHEEKMSYTMMHRLVWKLKRLMEKVPFGKSRLASYATALWLIKEGKDFKGSDENLQESVLSFFETDWEQEAILLKEEHDKYVNKKSFTKFMVERTLTPAEKKKKEAMVLKLKKNMTDLEDRYGDQATAVMHGIATKVAKGENLDIDEVKSDYEDEIAAFKKKGGKVKKLKPGKKFKSLFKQKGPKKPPRKEEVEIEENPMVAGAAAAAAKKALDKKKKKDKKEEVEIDEKWKKGTYTITDVKTGKVLGKYNSGAKAQKAADDIFQKGDYDAVAVEVDEEIVYTRGVDEKHGGFHFKKGQKFKLKQFKHVKPKKASSKKGSGSQGDTNFAFGISRKGGFGTGKGYGKRGGGPIMFGEDEIDEEVAPHAKVMAKRGDSPEEIKKMHPEITEDELEKLYEHCGICGEKGYGQFKLELEAVDSEDEMDEMKMSNAAKKKKAKWAKSSAGKKSLKKSAKRAKKVAKGSIKIDKAKGKAMARARKKGGIRNEFEVERESYPEGTEEYLNHCKEITPGEKVSEELSNVVTFSDYMTEGRSKLTPDQEYDRLGIQAGDKQKAALVGAQRQTYSLKDIQSLAKKHKVHLDGEPVGGTKEWDFEWQIAIRGGINLEYKPRSNSFEIRGWKVDKKKLRAYKDKYEPMHTRMADVMPMGGKMQGRGFETALELIGEQTELIEKKKTNEEAPTNNAGSGNVNLEPHAKKKKKKYKPEEFGGHIVFVVSSQRFWDSRLGKSRYARYEKYVGNDEIGEAIRVYGRANPKSPIILKNSDNGAMLYLKYGKRG